MGICFRKIFPLWRAAYCPILSPKFNPVFAFLCPLYCVCSTLQLKFASLWYLQEVYWALWCLQSEESGAAARLVISCVQSSSLLSHLSKPVFLSLCPFVQFFPSSNGLFLPKLSEVQHVHIFVSSSSNPQSAPVTAQRLWCTLLSSKSDAVIL